MPKVYADEELIEAVETRKRHQTAKAAAKALGVTEHTLANRLRHASLRGLDGSTPQPLPPGQTIRGVSTLWKQDEGGEWVESLKWVKTKNEEDRQALLDAIREAFDGYKGHAPLIKAPKDADKDLLSVYPIADQHIGLMSWGEETGEDYDLKIASERLRDCASKLISQSPPSEQAIILNLGDWQHTDDSRNATPMSGNRLDVDGRFMKVLQTGVMLMMDVVEMALQKHHSIMIRNIPGNHDPHTALALTVALGAFYHNNPRVIVDDDPSEFFFFRFGQTLIGANHGHRVKPQDMAMVMANYRKEDWGLTKFKVAYMGHIHHASAKEVAGVRVETFQTLAAKDAWSHAMGHYSGKSITSITHHLDRGEVGRHMVSV